MKDIKKQLQKILEIKEQQGKIQLDTLRIQSTIHPILKNKMLLEMNDLSPGFQ